MHELIPSSSSSSSNDEDKGEGVKPWIVYLGDSPTDLGCLLNADLGICVRDGDGDGDGKGAGGMTSEQKALRGVLDRVGVDCRWIGELEGRKGAVGEEGEWKGRLWWARDFDEVRKNGVLDDHSKT